MKTSILFRDLPEGREYYTDVGWPHEQKSWSADVKQAKPFTHAQALNVRAWVSANTFGPSIEIQHNIKKGEN